MASGSQSDSMKSSNKTHYARLGHAAQNLIPKLMQELLAFLEPKERLFQDCGRNMYLRNNLNSAEWKAVQSAATDGYGNFDIPLVYKILRNLQLIPPPTNYWDHYNDPALHEITIGDDVERCRRKRNEIIHRGNTSVTDLELADYFNAFKQIAGRLQNALNKTNNEFVLEFHDLETCCMDEATEEKYLKDLQAYKDEIIRLKEAAGTPTEDIQVNVEVIEPLADITCVERETVTLRCVVSGAKNIAQWSKNDEEILYERKSCQEVLCDRTEEGSRIYTYKLTIQQINMEDSGKYTLKLGPESFECTLTVTERKPTLIQLRNYQEELAEIALTGENTIICSGTNAGKTYVAYHIIEDHLIKNSQGKVIFINKTNVLLQQQYERACGVFKDLFFQGKIYKWDASQEGECEPFASIVNRVDLFFCTPQSLCNHLDEKAKSRVSLDNISLIIFDECHHVLRRNPFNEILSYYRRYKYESKSKQIPQIIGLTASPGTDKSTDVISAMEHLKKLMTSMGVSKLSVVRKHEEELLKYSSTPTKVLITSTQRKEDPVKAILLQAIESVENVFNNEKITNFLMTHDADTRILFTALMQPPNDKVGTRYLQWIGETKRKIESVMLKDPEIPRLLHICFRHIELFVDCLEINSLLEIDQVREILIDGVGLLSYESQQANTVEERKLVDKLKEVSASLLKLGRNVEKNPDVYEIIKKLEEEYEKQKEESRFLIFVKTRASAKALAKRLPDNLKCTYLTGSQKSKDNAGLHVDKQLEVMERFRDGEHLCIVATSVACEGLDIPQCNLMIRYKFNVDEISSYQMRGRIRDKKGKEVVVASQDDFEREDKNILRQYFMKLAIEQVMNFDLTDHIAVAEKSLYQSEVTNRWLEKIKSDGQRKGNFSVHCKFCGKHVTDGQYMRHINKKNYVTFDPNIFTRVKRVPARLKKFDTIKRTEKVSGRICGHDWGSILVYEECDFVALSKNNVNFFENFTKSLLKFKKWSEFPFAIDKLSDDEIMKYSDVYHKR